MNLATAVRTASAVLRREMDGRKFVSLPIEVLAAIIAVRINAEEIGEITGQSEPSDDELRDLWAVLKVFV